MGDKKAPSPVLRRLRALMRWRRCVECGRRTYAEAYVMGRGLVCICPQHIAPPLLMPSERDRRFLND